MSLLSRWFRACGNKPALPRIAHIINPVDAKPGSDLVEAQPITFESMRRAQDFARNTCQVRLIAACYTDEQRLVPPGFHPGKPLTRDVTSVFTMEHPRRLPLLIDLLRSGAESCHDEYLIYSNVDIAPMPHFYETVLYYLKKGCDALVINRRTIPRKLTAVEDLPRMYSHLGMKHGGHDCFIFHRSLLDRFELEQVCIGMAGVGRAFLANLLAHAKKFKELPESHLTFHVGDDMSWHNPKFQDLRLWNVAQMEAVLNRYLTSEAVIQHPDIQYSLSVIEKLRNKTLTANSEEITF